MRRSGAAQRGNTPRRATGGVKSSGSKVSVVASSNMDILVESFLP